MEGIFESRTEAGITQRGFPLWAPRGAPRSTVATTGHFITAPPEGKNELCLKWFVGHLFGFRQPKDRFVQQMATIWLCAVIAAVSRGPSAASSTNI
jgi:hypothetical protein